MSYDTFSLAVKSTLDYEIRKLSEGGGYAYVDLDGSQLNAQHLQSDAPSVAWAMLSFTPSPRRPLWLIEFEVGGKTSQDPAQYVSMEIVSLIQSRFHAGATVNVLDYSKPWVPEDPLGVISVVQATVAPQMFDRSSGLRLVNVVARAQELL